MPDTNNSRSDKFPIAIASVKSISISTLIILCLLIFLPLLAEDIKVIKFEENTMDLTAATEQRLDNNSKPCALLKVQSKLPGMIFEGNIVGDVEYRGGEYYVYMTEGSKMLKIKHNTCEPAMVIFGDQNRNIPSVASKRVYEMKLSVPTAPVATEKETFTCIVSPPNASVFIDSEEYELQNGQLSIPLTCEEHDFIFAATGYLSNNFKKKVTKNGTNRMKVELDPKPGYTPPSTASSNSNNNNSSSNNNNNSNYNNNSNNSNSNNSSNSSNNNNYNNNYNNSTSYTVGNTINGHEYVDLGLPSGLKWATCNVGATTPEAYGDYFAWAETTPKASYTGDNCPTCKKDISWLRANGYLDSNGNLTPSHDAARQNWGGTWRLPTKAEMEELVDNTTTNWTQRNGVNGRLITSKKNGNSIFIPAAGFRYGTSLFGDGSGGLCWGSPPHESGSESACSLYVGSDNFDWGWYYRDYGFSVRAVSE